MKVFKIVLCFIDFDGIEDPDEVKDLIEGAKLPNHIDIGNVMSIEGIEIGEWKDINPLNYSGTSKTEFKRLFPS